jgi:hypothetical protein
MAWLRSNPAPGVVLLGHSDDEVRLFLSHLGPLAAIPVVVMAYGPTPFPGAAEVLVKPFDVQVMVDTVARYC